MTSPSLRRLVLGAAVAASALLASCGGGDIVDPFQPTRIVSFGDALSDVGQTGNKYTVNDGTANNVWIEQTAARYGLTLTPASAGGTGYAQGNARVKAKPDATGGTSTRTVAEQIDAFLGAGGGIRVKDLYIVNGGISDLIAETVNTTQTPAQRLANVQLAARDLGAQVRRLANAGASHVVVVGAFNLRITPWAAGIGQGAEGSELFQLSSAFNDALLLSIEDLGSTKRVDFVDTANFFNLRFNRASAFSFDNTTTPACASTASGADGIGISASAHVSSRRCTPSTLAANVTDYNRVLFADPVYPTPALHRLFGDFVFETLRERF